MMRSTPGFVAVLLLLGAGWGLSIPLIKVTVSAGYLHFGLVFWQLAIGAAILGIFLALRGQLVRPTLPHLVVYLVIAVLGTIIPNSASYQAVAHLPAGIMSITIAAVPMFAFPIALALGIDRFQGIRFLGLALGMAGVVVLAAPGLTLPGAGLTFWLLMALVGPFCYGIEGNAVARWGTAGLDPVQVLFGASATGALVMAPVAWGTGHWIDPRAPWGGPEFAFLASAIIHACVYSGYVWLVKNAGSVFAAQVSYGVTLFGVVWAMLLLGERYQGGVWVALVLMMVGMFFVQPRKAAQ